MWLISCLQTSPLKLPTSSNSLGSTNSPTSQIQWQNQTNWGIPLGNLHTTRQQETWFPAQTLHFIIHVALLPSALPLLLWPVGCVPHVWPVLQQLLGSPSRLRWFVPVVHPSLQFGHQSQVLRTPVLASIVFSSKKAVGFSSRPFCPPLTPSPKNNNNNTATSSATASSVPSHFTTFTDSCWAQHPDEHWKEDYLKDSPALKLLPAE